MKKIIDNCCGCGVCEAVCAKKSIALMPDEHGFYKAFLNNDTCVDCGLCVKVCPQRHSIPFISHSVSRHYVAQVADKMVLQYSSSGGVAYELGRWAIRNGYKVVGTTYDTEQDRAVWKIADKESELSLFSGSKYIQSIPSGIISQFDKQDKYLVVGTPCQIAGLVKYIETKRFDRNKFLLVDFHCHGVPSYIVWDKYVEYVKKRMDVKNFTNVQFRSKSLGWHRFLLRFESETKTYYSNNPTDHNVFYDYFFGHAWLNESCYTCSYKRENSMADIKLGDCWNKNYKDNKLGLSALSVFTEVGDEVIQEIKRDLLLKEDAENVVCQGQIQSGAKKNKYADKIEEQFRQGGNILAIRFRYLFLPSLFPRVMEKLSSILFRKH